MARTSTDQQPAKIVHKTSRVKTKHFSFHSEDGFWYETFRDMNIANKEHKFAAHDSARRSKQRRRSGRIEETKAGMPKLSSGQLYNQQWEIGIKSNNPKKAKHDDTSRDDQQQHTAEHQKLAGLATVSTQRTLPTWICQMRWWLENVPHGKLQRSGTERYANHLMKHIKYLASGIGICYSDENDDDATFCKGVKVHIDSDIRSLLQKAKQIHGSEGLDMIKCTLAALEQYTTYRANINPTNLDLIENLLEHIDAQRSPNVNSAELQNCSPQFRDIMHQTYQRLDIASQKRKAGTPQKASSKLMNFTNCVKLLKDYAGQLDADRIEQEWNKKATARLAEIAEPAWIGQMALWSQNEEKMMRTIKLLAGGIGVLSGADGYVFCEGTKVDLESSDIASLIKKAEHLQRGDDARPNNTLLQALSKLQDYQQIYKSRSEQTNVIAGGWI